MANPTKGYTAEQRLDLEFLLGNYIDDVPFIIQNPDGTPFDFSGAVTPFHTIRIYTGEKKTNNRELLSTLTQVTGDLTEISGTVTWDGDFPPEITEFGWYHYEMDYTDIEGDKRIGEGKIKVV